MMAPVNDGWITSRIDECKSRVLTLGYDGCALDVLGLAPMSAGFVTALPINPRTHMTWTKVDWITATAGLAARVTAATHAMGKVTIGNGLSTGAYYFDRANPTWRLLSAMDGGIAESWLRGAHVGVNTYRTESAWKNDVDMLVDAEANGKPILALTKMWAPATQAQKDTWRRYSLASFLLGTGGRSYFYFSDAFNASRTAGHPWYSTDMGSPVGPYAKIDNVYQRSFNKGRVLVNPSSNTFTVPLGIGTYHTIDGQTASGSVVLAANGAQILVEN